MDKSMQKKIKKILDGIRVATSEHEKHLELTVNKNITFCEP